MWRMARTRLARKRAPTPIESGEGPSGDLGGVPSGRLEDVPEVGLTGEPEGGRPRPDLERGLRNNELKKIPIFPTRKKQAR